ncbi:MAG: Nitroreductase [candidate division TM6 bacterium GW2011_GWF2_37_49]|nr:MAG: Nitroreductase [candidate division TM6 bacterium GW2011_GWF2_37_49]
MSNRESNHDVNKLILHRWSPRAMSGEVITKDELMTLFDAARWAQSSYNNQPWRFAYAFRETPVWATFFNLLVPFNQDWCKNAAVLIVASSKKDFDFNGKPSRTHSFDAGAALQNLALQGYEMNLVIHGMEGFDYDKAKQELLLPDGYAIEAMFAVGKPGDKYGLPKELQEREEPSWRNEIATFAFEGGFAELAKK